MSDLLNKNLNNIQQETDLFGNPIVADKSLRKIYIEPPFSVLDSKGGVWQSRKAKWISLGIKSELGREAPVQNCPTSKNPLGSMEAIDYTSIFDPVLCEILYKWFCPFGGAILDPFAGGSVRGIVANYKGYKYSGIDLSEDQIKHNFQQARTILASNNIPKWIVGDSEVELDKLSFGYDFIFSCPPYHDLEKYSSDDRDLSNMDYNSFCKKYHNIIQKSIDKLKDNRFCVFVVGEIRNKDGFYKNFVPMTKSYFIKSGVFLYNEIILLNAIASASMRADRQFSAFRKVVKVHQNILVFYKGNNPQKIRALFNEEVNNEVVSTSNT